MGSTEEMAAPGETRATTSRMPRKSRKQGFRTLPIQVKIFPGRREKKSVTAKKATENSSRKSLAWPSGKICSRPTV